MQRAWSKQTHSDIIIHIHFLFAVFTIIDVNITTTIVTIVAIVDIFHVRG